MGKLSVAATRALGVNNLALNLNNLKLDLFNLGGGGDLILLAVTQFWIWICFPTHRERVRANLTV